MIVIIIKWLHVPNYRRRSGKKKKKKTRQKTTKMQKNLKQPAGLLSPLDLNIDLNIDLKSQSISISIPSVFFTPSFLYFFYFSL